MCPYSLHSHVVTNGIYNYKPNHGCSHIDMFWRSVCAKELVIIKMVIRVHKTSKTITRQPCLL